jgi:hypothetical protein
MSRLFLACLLLCSFGCGGLVAWDDSSNHSAGGHTYGGSAGTDSLSNVLLGGWQTTADTRPSGGIPGLGGQGSGGAATGGTATGGQNSGGATTGSAAAGGQSSGGATTGAQSTGGASTGGAATGGQSSGGAATGGTATGGQSSGGASTGGQGTGGNSGYISAYYDGTTLDVRLSLDILDASASGFPTVNLSVTSDSANQHTMGWWPKINFSTEQPTARLWIDIDSGRNINLDPCGAVEIDSAARLMRIKVPVQYLTAPPYTVTYVTHQCPHASDCSTMAVQTTEPPPFSGHSMDCPQNWDLNIGQLQFVQLLSYSGIDASIRGCALDIAGEIHCWNYPLLQVALDIPTGPFLQLGVLGPLQACGLRSTGSLACFQLTGVPTDLDPPPVPEGTFKRMSEYGNCGILVDGQVRCWAIFSGDVPLAIEGNFIEVSGNLQLGCALDQDGRPRCWQAQDPNVSGAPSMNFDLLDDIYQDVAVGSDVVCALTRNGEVDCIGPSWNAKLRLIGGPYHWLGGPGVLCAIDDADRAMCIGHTDSVPTYAFKQVALGEWTDPPCGLLLDGRLACWNAQDYVLP